MFKIKILIMTLFADYGETEIETPKYEYYNNLVQIHD